MVRRSLPTRHHHCEFLAPWPAGHPEGCIWEKDPKTVFHGAFCNLRYREKNMEILLTIAILAIATFAMIGLAIIVMCQDAKNERHLERWEDGPSSCGRGKTWGDVPASTFAKTPPARRCKICADIFYKK